MHKLAKLDQRYIWHPFTQMRDWAKHEPIVLERGKGAVLEDVRGKKYLDGNASIWTNLHGHDHPQINRAIQKQLRKTVGAGTNLSYPDRLYRSVLRENQSVQRISSGV